jgi:hypothetical protein
MARAAVSVDSVLVDFAMPPNNAADNVGGF